MAGDLSRTAYMMVLVSVIGLFTIPMLPWMGHFSRSDAEDKSYSTYVSEAEMDMYNGTGREGRIGLEDGAYGNIRSDIAVMSILMTASIILSIVALIGIFLRDMGRARRLRLAGSLVMITSVLFLMFNLILIRHVQDLNDEFGGTEELDFGTNTSEYTLGLNYIPMACSILLQILSASYTRDLDREKAREAEKARLARYYRE